MCDVRILETVVYCPLLLAFGWTQPFRRLYNIVRRTQTSTEHIPRLAFCAYVQMLRVRRAIKINKKGLKIQTDWHSEDEGY